MPRTFATDDLTRTWVNQRVYNIILDARCCIDFLPNLEGPVIANPRL